MKKAVTPIKQTAEMEKVALALLQHVRDKWQIWGVIAACVMAGVMLVGFAVGVGGAGLVLVKVWHAPERLDQHDQRLINAESNSASIKGDLSVLQVQVKNLDSLEKRDHNETMQILRHLDGSTHRMMEPSEEYEMMPLPVPGTNETVYADPVPIINGDISYYAWPPTNCP
jgi:hypothetical protein